MQFMYFKSNCQSCHPKRYCHHQVQCGRKVAEVFLDAGQKYLGEINQGQFLNSERILQYLCCGVLVNSFQFLATCLLAEVPDGHGVQYFLQTPDKEEYEGICS